MLGDSQPQATSSATSLTFRSVEACASSPYDNHEHGSTMSYFFSTPVDIDIVLDDGDDRQMVDMKADKGRREKAPLYKDGESVKGAVTVRPKDGKRLEHTGIKVQFIGTIGPLLPSPLPSIAGSEDANEMD